MNIAKIVEYPIKALRGNPLQEARVGKRGLENDRRWMIINADNNFISQRTYPALARLKVVIGPTLQLIDIISGDKTEMPNVTNGPFLDVTIWGTKCLARTGYTAIDSFLSQYLLQPVKLVFMPDESVRQVDQNYAQQEDEVSFADGYPVLLTNLSTLKSLNDQLDSPIGIDRFRANLVFDGSEAFEEEHWSIIQIGEVRFRVAKPCSRCRVINVDQSNGKNDSQVLRTLSLLRGTKGHTDFGVNLIPDNEGKIGVGDELTVLEWASDRETH